MVVINVLCDYNIDCILMLLPTYFLLSDSVICSRLYIKYRDTYSVGFVLLSNYSLCVCWCVCS